jgi:hypothetical protein
MAECMPFEISCASSPFAMKVSKFHYRYNEATDEDRANRWRDSEGLIDAELLEDMLPERDADYYFCDRSPSWSAFITIC